MDPATGVWEVERIMPSERLFRAWYVHDLQPELSLWLILLLSLSCVAPLILFARHVLCPCNAELGWGSGGGLSNFYF